MSDRWREWRGFILFLAVMLLFRSAIADWNQVPSGSMLPSILVGDRIVVDKLAYDLRLPLTFWRIARWRDPARGDVVTFTSPADDRLLVKRVIGLPGDVVAMTDNRLTINGAVADYQLVGESGAAAPTGMPPAYGYHQYRESLLGSERFIMVRGAVGDSPNGNLAPVRIPPHHYLMLGDNRDNSRDSREIGFIARDRIVGKATRVAFSLDYDNYYAPRMGRFLAELP